MTRKLYAGKPGDGDRSGREAGVPRRLTVLAGPQEKVRRCQSGPLLLGRSARKLSAGALQPHGRSAPEGRSRWNWGRPTRRPRRANRGDRPGDRRHPHLNQGSRDHKRWNPQTRLRYRTDGPGRLACLAEADEIVSSSDEPSTRLTRVRTCLPNLP